jgi:hypothetical protein
MPSHFGPIFLTENFVTLACDPSTWEDHIGHGSYSYLVYWETGVPYKNVLTFDDKCNCALL